MTTGWKLSESCRAELLRRLGPRYARVVADHVTLASGKAGEEGEAPHPVGRAEIIGRADDGAGVEAYVVAIDGLTDRPDGGTWHVTWSLGHEREARESNAAIAECGWTEIPARPLELIPAKW